MREDQIGQSQHFHDTMRHSLVFLHNRRHPPRRARSQEMASLHRPCADHTHIGFFIIWATNIYDDGKYLSGDGPICNSEARQCGLYYHTKNHTLAFLGRSLTFLGVLVSKRPRVPGCLCVDSSSFFFFFFSFLSFFLYYDINKRPVWG